MVTNITKQKPVECIALKVELARRDLDSAALADMIGTTEQVINNIRAGKNRCRPMRRRIEQALGCPIWSSLEAFKNPPPTKQQKP